MEEVKTNWGIIFLGIFIFFLSLVPRIYRIELEGVNPDEPIWHGRIKNFVSAVYEGNFFYTQQSLHPAVTLEWITAGGRVSGGHQQKSFPYSDPQEFFDVRNSQIIPIAFIVSFSIFLIFIFLNKLTENVFLSFISTFLISLNPFFIAHSRVLQMDGLLGSFMILSLLSLLIYKKKDHDKWLYTSSVFGGLAILTKLPALFLLPFVALLLFPRFKKIFLWGIVASIVFIALYPAIWVEPVLSIKNLIYGLVGRGLTDPHPGAEFNSLFYLVVLAFRTTPITFIFGILAVIWAVLGKKVSPLGIRRSDLKEIFLFTLFFLIQMTLVAKKSDRYLIPSILGLDLLAGFGLVLLFKRFKFPLVLSLITVYLLLISPIKGHFLSYYNPIFGGAKAAKENLVVGWGEGLYEVSEYLNEKGGVVGYYGEGLRPLIKGEFHNLVEEPQADIDFLVLYINQVQRDRYPEALQKYYYSAKPEHVVKINGIEYAWIYRAND